MKIYSEIYQRGSSGFSPDQVRPYYCNSKEQLSKFKEFKALLENRTRKELKNFRIGGGGEYLFTEFQEYLKESGTKRDPKAPYTLDQNERNPDSAQHLPPLVSHN